ncbi:3-hydroxyacyl-CoA dehydrogenase family protein [Aporhodopirellula aestuarii]|uniref:3-hydroxyacyl-CoA dehydrogenase family protein n=1 Tax=Aporhodopirellula aestuarii TaxID=2950107 RepID=A0ABT0U3H5_9BACT|nr:3-hydroxyacyl-CoA dehydrogenase family protein [Aporhodopirellula aestuarii]MCM2371467.1 3-hydroxyacyl-CoA dehydrogenase family protein [Aporhodopirellula aestuarii]
MNDVHGSENQHAPVQVLLVGAGVVGRAIAVDHLRSGIEVWMSDVDEDVLRKSCDLVLRESDGVADSASPWGARIPMPIVHFSPPETRAGSQDTPTTSAVPRWLLIESIAERLDVKQAFFAQAEQWFDRAAVLTTNTSTLPIGSIAAKMQSPEQLCGLHFFMPVTDRPAAEIIPHQSSSDLHDSNASTHPEVVQTCCEHVKTLGKTPLKVRDAPGFVVNRLLAPYLNLATDLLCGGIEAQTIRTAALRYGMPISPFELVDLIGTRTAFDGGRIVWSAFPGRMDPSPLLPALVKRKLAGVAVGEGFYRYDESGNRMGDDLSPLTAELAAKYRHDSFANFPHEEEDRINLLTELLAAAIRLEAIAIEQDGVADAATINAAMKGGLGWKPDVGDKGPIDTLSPERAQELANRFPKLKSIQP